MIIDDAPGIPALSDDSPPDDRGPGQGAGPPLSVDRISQLRHDLRNPVNQILGYAELLIEEMKERGRPGPPDRLRSILARGKQVADVINEGLPPVGEGEAEGAIDLDALRSRLLEPVGGIIADCDELAGEADDPSQGEFRRDVGRIRAGAARLAELADAMVADPLEPRGGIADAAIE